MILKSRSKIWNNILKNGGISKDQFDFMEELWYNWLGITILLIIIAIMIKWWEK